MSAATLEDIKAFAIAELRPLREGVSGRTALAQDFSIACLDGKEFLEAYSSRFNVDLDGFDWVKYFGAEVGANPLGLVLYLFNRFVRGIPARELSGLPEITLDHLALCAKLGKWQPPD